METARWELAGELLEYLRCIDTRMREARKKLAKAAAAAGTSLTSVFGVGPVIAAAVIGEVRDVSRFASRDRFAAYDGTAPIEVSSGQRKVHRLSRRGNRRLNHAARIAAITQVGHRHSEGRAYYDKKLAEGKTPKEALRALKRQLSNAIFGCLQARCPAIRSPRRGPGRAAGERLCRQRGRLAPQAPALRTSHSRARTPPYDPSRQPSTPSLTQREKDRKNPLTQRGFRSVWRSLFDAGPAMRHRSCDYVVHKDIAVIAASARAKERLPCGRP